MRWQVLKLAITMTEIWQVLKLETAAGLLVLVVVASQPEVKGEWWGGGLNATQA